jgi:amino acid adenylation domain-containing protein
VPYLLSQLIDDAADRDASHEACCGVTRRLDYGELVTQSNRLAHLLVEHGVRPGQCVGIHLPRTPESLVAVYGILRAGAAFVPIDPHVPVNALCQLVRECGIRHIVSHERARPHLEQLAAATPLDLVLGVAEGIDGVRTTATWSALDGCHGGAAPDVARSQLDMAYIMFSSGSTGRPKGIVHTHGSGLAYAIRSAELYEVVPGDRIANHSPLHFDMSTFGYFTGPLAGATTLLIPQAHTKMAASLTQLIEQERITIWYSVPLALVQMLLRGVLEARHLESIRWVLYGGEPFPVKHMRALMQAWPNARFSNVYGPAEVNQCTYYHVPPLHPDDDDESPIPIGQVWDDAEGLVLDTHDAPVEPGDAGELVVRTPTMMAGYWKRPDLNAAAYFRRTNESGLEDVFYRTGDLVRHDEAGRLLFLGRKDRQVKIRGYRIEVDDVEHMLCSHADVESAAAFPIKAGGDDDRIEAAVVLRDGADVDGEDLRKFLADHLSWYAVPARIEIMNEFPRTTSGKIDRRCLQAMAHDAVAERSTG